MQQNNIQSKENQLYNKHRTPLSEERNERIQKVLAHRQNSLTVVLENVHDPHNIAAVMRTCDAVGIMEIFVLNTISNPFRNFDLRKSSSANKWMMVHEFADVHLCFEHVKQKYTTIYSTFLNETSNDLYDLSLIHPTALVFGNEKKGISNETLSYCTSNFSIPQVGIIKSLNISVACSVSIYEAFRQKRLAGHYNTKQINPTEQAQLLKFWDMQE